MRKTKRLPDYSTIIGEGTEVNGGIRFCGGMHIDGKVVGDVSAMSEDGCALTLARSGVIRGNLEVAHVVLDGAVSGDVRAAHRAVLASGARIEGDLYYGALEMAEGAEVNGKLFRTDGVQPPRFASHAVAELQVAGVADPKENMAEPPAGDRVDPDKIRLRSDGDT
jgi:cytoskeletal protein CcmA (bactofilin family)